MGCTNQIRNELQRKAISEMDCTCLCVGNYEVALFNPENDDVLPGPTDIVVLTPYVKEKAPGRIVNKIAWE